MRTPHCPDNKESLNEDPDNGDRVYKPCYDLSFLKQMRFYDIDYVTNLREMARKYLNSSKVVLFSVDGCGPEYLRNGKIPGKDPKEILI